MYDANFLPRTISATHLDEGRVFAGMNFEHAAMAPGHAPRTCNFGFTYMCDSDGRGGTCRTGHTFKCDGPGPVRG
jgi:hypothetical protein